MQVNEREPHHFGRRVDDADAAGGELPCSDWIEQCAPAVGGRDVQRLDLALVVTDADGAEGVVDGVLIARIVRGNLPHECRIEMRQIRKTAFVESEECAAIDFAANEVRRRHHDIEAAVPGEQAAFQCFVRVEVRYVDLDPALRRKAREGAGCT